MRTPPTENPALAGAMGGGQYTMFPGTKKQKADRSDKAEGKDRRRRKSDLRSWRTNALEAIPSDVSFLGYYDDARLQEMAETMRSEAADKQNNQIC
ncbi:hypothetical protein COOONC_20901 [Cooperia oncophora]